MDEIFDRIRTAKINRKYLVISLIFTEILGIITLTWYLKAPLYKKFLTTPPQAYLLSQMNTQTRYLFAQGDFIKDQAPPGANIVILLSEGSQVLNKSKTIADSSGQWYYQIPEDTAPGIKNLTIGNLDQNNNLQTHQSYKVRIKSNKLINFKYASPQSVPPAELPPLTEIISTGYQSPEDTTPTINTTDPTSPPVTDN